MIPSIFAFLLLFQTSHSVTLTWVDATNPAGTTYSVYAAPGLCSGTPSFTKIANGVTAKTYIETPVPVGNRCYYVTANYTGIESAPSNSALAVVGPFAVSGLSLTVQ